MTILSSFDLEAENKNIEIDGKMPEEERKTYNFVWNRIEEMTREQEKFHEEWDYADEVMEGAAQLDKVKEGIRISLSRMITEHAIAEEINAFSDIEYEAVEPEDRHKEVMVSAAKDDVLEETMWEHEKIKGFRTRRTYGTAPFKIGYVKTKATIKEMTIGETMEDIDWIEKEICPIDGIRIECITDPRRFLLDPSAYDVHEADDCALLTEMSLDQFNSKYGKNKTFTNTENIGTTTYGGDDGFDSVMTRDSNSKQMTNKSVVKVWEYWNRELNMYVVVASGATTRVIKNCPLPDHHNRLPFATMHMYRRPDSYYSMGVPKVLEHIEIPFNALIQAELRATQLAFPMIATESGEMFSTTGLEAYPGLVLHGALDKVKLQPLGSVPSEVYQLKQELIKQAVMATGVNFEQVYDTKSDRVGIEALKKESQLALINSNIRQNEAVFITQLGMLLERCIQQYYPVPKIEVLLGDAEMNKYKEYDRKQVGKDMVGLKYRKVRIKNMKLKESYDSEKFALSQNEVDGSGYFLARPEYIRTLSPLHVKVVRPAAMGGSKEAKKITAQEFLNTASDINAIQMQYQKEAVFDIASIGQLIAELNDLPIDKVMAKKESQGSALEAINKVANPLEDMLKNSPTFPQTQNVENPIPQEQAEPAFV